MKSEKMIEETRMHITPLFRCKEQDAILRGERTFKTRHGDVICHFCAIEWSEGVLSQSIVFIIDTLTYTRDEYDAIEQSTLTGNKNAAKVYSKSASITVKCYQEDKQNWESIAGKGGLSALVTTLLNKEVERRMAE